MPWRSWEPTWTLAAIGLLIGTAARYAMRLQDHLAITWREVMVDLGLLGFNALLTLWTIDRLGATGKGAVLTAALFGVGQDRVVRVARKWFERRAEKVLTAAGLGDEPEKPDPAAEQRNRLNALAAGLRRGLPPTRSPEDQIELLRRLENDG